MNRDVDIFPPKLRIKTPILNRDKRLALPRMSLHARGACPVARGEREVNVTAIPLQYGLRAHKSDIRPLIRAK